MAKIGEVFGTRVDQGTPAVPPPGWVAHECPFTNRECDVTGNRSNMSFLEPPKRATPEERELFVERYGAYGKPHFPFSVCTVTTQRRSLSQERPWIVCPKRMLDLRPSGAQIPDEIRQLMPDIESGQRVRIWWEVKFTHKDSEGPGSFDYTFDFLLAPVETIAGRTRFSGPPYALEVMTSSTRGGGLTEHLWDVLLGFPQRPLRGVVDSLYTPNYRQVFGRMLSQFFVKCETLAAWGGRAIWLVQDELLSYIEESTDFDRGRFRDDVGAGTFVVYGMKDETSKYTLHYLDTVIGPTRPARLPDDVAFMTDMVGAGYVPPIDLLEEMLLLRPRTKAATNWREIEW